MTLSIAIAEAPLELYDLINVFCCLTPDSLRIAERLGRGCSNLLCNVVADCPASTTNGRLNNHYIASNHAEDHHK